MARSTKRITKTSTIRPRRVRFKYVIARRSHDSRYEHGSAVHEGTEQSNARTSGEQQLLLHKRQHRTRRLRMVRYTRRLLGWNSSTV